MHKRAFQALKRTFMHVSGLAQPYFDKKPITLEFGFFKTKICWKETSDMHKRAFQALKRTFMHVSGLPPPLFDKKKQLYYKLDFLNQNMLKEDLTHV